MPKEIPLTQGQVAIVSDEDYERVSQYKWCAYWSGTKWYAMTSRRRVPVDGWKSITMHRFILDAQSGTFTDHIDRDGLNNRRENLRFCTRSQNEHNKTRRSDNKSGFKGVYWHKTNSKWAAQITVNGDIKRLGFFDTPEEAARVYDISAEEFHGEFACTNFAVSV